MDVAWFLTKVYLANLIILVGAYVAKLGWRIIKWGSGISGIKVEQSQPPTPEESDYIKRYQDKVQ